MLESLFERRRPAAALESVRGKAFGRDVAAAFALLAVAIPEQIATARLAGAPPALGLLVFVAASIGFFLLGSNRYLSAGADSTIAPIFAAGLAILSAAGSPHYLSLAALLAVLVGIMVALTGLLRLGWVSRLLSIPVIAGFLAGISVHIALAQLPEILGAAAIHGAPWQEMAAIPKQIEQAHPLALFIGLGAFFAVLGLERSHPRLPGALMAMVAAALASVLFNLDQKGVPTLGPVSPPSLWPPAISLDPAEAAALLPLALLIALIVIIQTVTVSKSFGAAAARDINHDLVGMGFGNLMSGILGGFPANSSPPRTAIVHESGAASRRAGLFAAMGGVFFLMFGPPLLAAVPKAALAGLLLFVAVRIFRIDVMKTVWSQSRAEFWLLLVTAAAIIVAPIEIGVTIGIGLSLLHGVWTITQVHAVTFEPVPGTTLWWPGHAQASGQPHPGLVVVGFPAPLFFLNAEAFRRTISEAVRSAPQPVRTVILEASAMVEIDYSGAQILAALVKEWKGAGMRFCIARLESYRAEQALKAFGIFDLVGEENVFRTVDDAVNHVGRS